MFVCFNRNLNKKLLLPKKKTLSSKMDHVYLSMEAISLQKAADINHDRNTHPTPTQYFYYCLVIMSITQDKCFANVKT